MKAQSKTILLLLGLTSLFVHSGCSVSEDATVSTESSGSNIRLSVPTVPSGVTAVIADGSSTVPIQVQITDATGRGINQKSVTFRTELGSLEPSPAFPPAQPRVTRGASTTRQEGEATTLTVSTDANGNAEVLLRAGVNFGTALVTAEARGFRTSVALTFVANVARVTMAATPNAVNRGGIAAIEATIRGPNNSIVVGETVTFTLSGNTSGATLSAASAVTDANGRASVTYTAGTTPGSDVVQAQASNGTTGTVTITVLSPAGAPAPPAPGRVDLLISSPQLNSDGSNQVNLTALVRDAQNNTMTGIAVSFAANANGSIQVLRGTTDATGTATAVLATGNDPSNRPITVTATAGALTSTNTVTVTGTTVGFSGANALVLSGTTTLSIFLRDFGNDGIVNQALTLTSALGNRLSAATVTTDFNGQATVTVTATVAGNDRITASALGGTVMGTFALSVSPDNFVFLLPAANSDVTLGTTQTARVRWLAVNSAGVLVPQVGTTLNFTTTRGTLSAATAVTDANGEAQITIVANNAGPAIITATTGQPKGPSTQVNIRFIATTPASLIVQASPTIVGVNAQGRTDQQSTITAVVRDAANNLVANQTVTFLLTDRSGGSISPASAITDDFGRASTVYTSGLAPSASDGVLIDARVGNVTGQVRLTVAQQALFVALGTGNLIETPSSTQYRDPYAVLVTDAAGNPVANAQVTLSVLPKRYEKGVYVRVADIAGACVGWGKARSINAASGFSDDADRACSTEDVNFNGILDPGEDINSNTELDPVNVATVVPKTVTTDSSGFGFFGVVYAREFTWVEVELEARATVAGSAASSKSRFFLRGLASDFRDCTVSPPGAISPYGIATTCACDELASPACPITDLSAPVTVSPDRVILPPGGGTVTLQVTGGSRTSYQLSTTLYTGLLSTTLVNFGTSFDLRTTAAQNSSTFLINARDSLTGQTGTATVTQGP